METQVTEATSAPHAGVIETDAVIVGAGPVGLFQVFELGLLEIKAHIIDSLAYPGGQCIELYPDKPIYDIPALPVVTGKELTDNLMKQIEPFGATFHLGQEVTTVEKQEDGRFFVATSKGTQFLTKTIFIAGAWLVPAAHAEGRRHRQVRGLAGPLPRAQPGAVRRQEPGDHRRRRLGPGLGAELLRRQRRRQPAQGRERHPGPPPRRLPRRAGFGGQDEGALRSITGGDGVTRVVPADQVLVFFGLSPKLGPIAEWGLALEKKQIQVDTEKFQTSVPGIFAVGDINTYPGKKKLILSGFHEAALAAFGAMPIINPEKRVHLQYTTTSPKLHKVLGVESPNFD
ncbi:pyridine nucleotide-disulfide oxidoreductase domain-containing protein [Ditylenchus destructor]|nr:pyridine nucleotide-disulfide oxidoreductase domain-containing protein [Ditylenchus destructor]